MWEKHKFTMRDVKNLSYEKVLKMGLEERADLAQYMRDMFKRRYNEAAKTEDIPFGMEKVQNEFKNFQEIYGVKLTDRITTGNKKGVSLSISWANIPYVNNVLGSYIMNLQEFFGWKSATVKGWSELRYKENLGLFGAKTDENGNIIYDDKGRIVAAYEMTVDERKKFWNLYHELIKRTTNTIVASDSEGYTNYAGIHENGLADMWVKMAAERDLVSMDGTALIEAMEESLEKGEPVFPEHDNDESGDNVNGNDPFGGVSVSANDAFN